MIPDDLETPGSLFRRQRGIDAGSPAADDMTRLQYAGADEVRWVIEQKLLPKLPAWVRWHAIEAVDWIEVGRHAYAWRHHAPTPRALPGDVCHRIVVMGLVNDDSLEGLLGHETAHSILATIRPVEPPRLPVAEVDMIAAGIYQSRGLTAEELDYERAVFISSCVANELRADRLARDVWGLPWRGHDPDELRRRFGAKYTEACRMARLAAEVDDEEHAA